MKRLLAIACLFFGLSTLTFAQGALEPKASPLDVATSNIGETYIKVVYSRPHMRGRDIFGELVPFGKVWRTGANAATEITFTEDVSIDGTTIPAGTYALFTIPNEDSWTVIINSELGQWGAYRYDEDKDVLRFDVRTSETDIVWEPFTIFFEANRTTSILHMVWDTTEVEFNITKP